MDHVLRGHDQPDRVIDRNVQRVDLGLAAGMLNLPHPLLGDDEDRQFVGVRPVDVEEQAGAPDEQAEKGNQRGGGPADLPVPALGDPVAAVDGLPAR